MPLVLSHCVPSDVPSFTSAVMKCYAPISPRYQVTYGGMSQAQQVEYFEKSYKTGIDSQSHPTSSLETHYLKITDSDSDTGEVIAFAVWKRLPQGYLKEDDPFVDPKTIPEGANASLMTEFGRVVGDVRGELEGRRKAHWLLDLLGTHPNHERRGAGGMLIRWGLDQAQEDGIPAYVDASPIGYKLYHRSGFTDVGKMVLDLDKYVPKKGFGVQEWIAMVKEPETR